MRSQVQVLAGPPPIVAGHSAAGSEPGAPAASPGRAGAARPSSPAPPVAPPGPPTRPSASATTTQRGQAPSPRTPATRRVQPPRAAACSRAHSAAARDGRSARRPGLPGRSAASAAAAARTQPAARVRHRPPPDQRDVGSVARLPASATVGRAVDGPAATGAFTGSGGQGPHRHRDLVPNATAGAWEETDTSGRTGQTLDGWTPDKWTADGWTPTGRQRTAERGTLWTTIPGDRTPDGWTAGSRTPIPDGWTPGTDAVACLLAVSTTATTPDLSRPAGRSCGQTPSGRATTRTAQQ
jgi:hypothetical protein